MWPWVPDISLTRNSGMTALVREVDQLIGHDMDDQD
jgi:hypothetical protein